MKLKSAILPRDGSVHAVERNAYRIKGKIWRMQQGGELRVYEMRIYT